MEKNISTTSSFLFFLKKNARPKKQKKSLISVNRVNKKDVINILDFFQYGLGCKYEIIFRISIYNLYAGLHFLIPSVTIAN